MRPPKSLLALILMLGTLSCASSFAARKPDGKEEPGLAHARAVSLSLVQGAVIVRKPGSPKWTRAKLDMALEEGMSIATARSSFAEVLFEDGSTVRIGELSRVDFTQMALAQGGARMNHMKVAFGVATANVAAGRHDEYVLNAAGATLTPQGKSEFRVDADHGRLRVEVFRGHLAAADSNQSAKLGKNQVLSREASASRPFEVTNPIHKDAWDQWVRARDEQAALAASQENAAMDAVLNDWSRVVPPPGMLAGLGLADGF